MNELERFYAGLEDKWYSFVESMGKPARRVVEPLERAGIPSFPAFLSLAAILLGAVIMLLLLPPSTTVLEVRTYADNAPVEGALVQVFADGAQLMEGETNSKGFVELGGATGVVEVRVSKRGLGTKKELIDLSERTTIKFDLTKPAVDLSAFASQERSNAEDTYGRLEVSVVDAVTRKPINAFATIFNAETHATLSTMEVRDGKALSQAIDLDAHVYVVVEADNYLPFNNADKPVKIKAGKNLVRASLEPAFTREKVDELAKTLAPGDLPEVNAAKVLVTVLDGENAVKGAKVALFKLNGTESIRLSSKTTDNDGRAAIIIPLANQTNKKYYLQATKSRYHDAYAEPALKESEELVMVLRALAEENTCVITVNVTNELDEPQRGAAVVLFEPIKFSFGIFNAVIREAKTGREGEAVLKDVKRAEYVVKASNGALTATAKTKAVEAENYLKIVLLDNPAFLRVNATDSLTGAQINAEYAAYYRDELLDYCIGFECVLEVKARKEFTLSVTASDYLPLNKTIGNLESEIESNESVRLYPVSALDGAYAEFNGVYSERTGGEVDALMTGHDYRVDYSLYTVEDAELSGIYFEVPDGVEITGRSPKAANEYAGGSCGMNDFDEEEEYEWIDLGYAGSKKEGLAVSVWFHVNEKFELDETHSGNASLKWRAYAVVDGNWLRNPFDAELREKAGDGLPSGCGAETEEQVFAVSESGTRCSENACITLWLEQGSRSGAEGFEAKSMEGYSIEDPDYEELEAWFELELRKDLDEDAEFVFYSEPAHYSLTRMQYDGCEEDEEPRGGEVPEGGFSVGFGGLRECDDYHDYDPETFPENYVVSGVVFGKPLQLTEESSLLAEFSCNGVTPHDTAWFKVVEGGELEPDYAEISINSILQKARGDLEDMDWGGGSYFAYGVSECGEPGSVYDDECSSSEPEETCCHHGYLEVAFEVTQKRARQYNYFEITTDSENLEFVGLKNWNADEHHGQPAVSGNSLFIELNDMEEGEKVGGTLLLKSFIQEGSEPVPAKIFLKHLSEDEFGEHATLNEADFMIHEWTGDDTSYIDWIFGGNCGGKIDVVYDESRSSEQKISLNGGECNQLDMLVNPILPADAVLLNVTFKTGGKILAQATYDPDGVAECFQVCPIREGGDLGYEASTPCYVLGKGFNEDGFYALQYDPEGLGCTHKYAVGNTVPNATINMSFTPSTDLRAFTNLTISVHNQTAPRIVLGPMITKFEQNDELLLYSPQLWIMKDNKQTTRANPSRFTIRISGSGDGLQDQKTIQFNGPSVQSFGVAIYPDTQFQIYEGSGSRAPLIFEAELDNPTKQTRGAYLYYNIIEFMRSENEVYTEYEHLLLGRSAQSGGEGLTSKQITELDSRKQFFEDAGLEVGREKFVDNANALLVERAHEIAEQYVYWRGNDQYYWCRKEKLTKGDGAPCMEYADDGTLEKVQYDDPNCCRRSVEEWWNVRIPEETELVPCSFCNNTRNDDCDDESAEHLKEFDWFNCSEPAPTGFVDCDSACKYKGGGFGLAEIRVGDSIDGQECTEQEAEDGWCWFSCTNWCGEKHDDESLDCEIGCGKDGYKEVTIYGEPEQDPDDPWCCGIFSGQKELYQVKVKVPRTGLDEFEDFQTFAPLSYLGQYYSKGDSGDDLPNFEYSYAVNTVYYNEEQTDKDPFYPETGINHLQGCSRTGEGKAYPGLTRDFEKEGIFQVNVLGEASLTGDEIGLWTAGAEPALLDFYVGTGCNNLGYPLCYYFYNYETENEQCIASVTQFKESDPEGYAPYKMKFDTCKLWNQELFGRDDCVGDCNPRQGQLVQRSLYYYFSSNLSCSPEQLLSGLCCKKNKDYDYDRHRMGYSITRDGRVMGSIKDEKSEGYNYYFAFIYFGRADENRKPEIADGKIEVWGHSDKREFDEGGIAVCTVKARGCQDLWYCRSESEAEGLGVINEARKRLVDAGKYDPQYEDQLNDLPSRCSECLTVDDCGSSYYYACLDGVCFTRCQDDDDCGYLAYCDTSSYVCRSWG